MILRRTVLLWSLITISTAYAQPAASGHGAQEAVRREIARRNELFVRALPLFLTIDAFLGPAFPDYQRAPGRLTDAEFIELAVRAGNFEFDCDDDAMKAEFYWERIEYAKKQGKTELRREAEQQLVEHLNEAPPRVEANVRNLTRVLQASQAAEKLEPHLKSALLQQRIIGLLALEAFSAIKRNELSRFRSPADPASGSRKSLFLHIDVIRRLTR